MGRKEDTLSYNRFVINRIGADIIEAMDHALRSEGSGGRVILVFMCRKAYWLYRLYRMNRKDWEKEYGDIVIATNRYVLKEQRLPVSEYDTIIIFDDTVSSGRSVKEAYDDIKGMYPNVTVKVKVAFSIRSKIELREILQKEVNDESFTSFFDNLEIYRVILPQEMGWVSSQEILAFQKTGIPYVIELPLVRDMQNISSLADVRDYYTVEVTEKEFKKMKKTGGFWSYSDYSYEFPDCMTAGDYYMTEIHSGFFWYHDPNLETILGKNGIQLIVKCGYSECDNGKIKAAFTPFAVMNSIRFEDAWEMFCVLYEKTDYLKEEQLIYKEYTKYAKKGCRDEENYLRLERQLGIAAYRAVVFFLSMYAFSLFKKMTDSILDRKLTVMDEVYMKEIYTTEFITYVKEMEQWRPEDFLNKIRNLKTMLPVPMKNSFTHTRFRYIKNDLNGMGAQIRLEILMKKRGGIRQRKSLAIEEIRDYIAMKLADQEDGKRENLLIAVILQMMDQSIIGNSLWMDQGIIRRGFQYGENSDIVFGAYFNPYIQILVEDLYLSYIWGNTDRREESQQWYKNAITQLFKELWNKKKENDVLDRYISDEQLEFAELYYGMGELDAGMMIENKNCFSSINCSDTIKTVLENWVRCFADSWI